MRELTWDPRKEREGKKAAFSGATSSSSCTPSSARGPAYSTVRLVGWLVGWLI